MYRLRDITGYLSNVADFDPPHMHSAPPERVIPVEFRGDLWRQKTGVPGLSCGVLGSAENARPENDGQTFSKL